MPRVEGLNCNSSMSMMDIRKHQTSTCRLSLEAICCAPPDDCALTHDNMSMDFEIGFAKVWMELKCHCKLVVSSCTGFQELMSSASALRVNIGSGNTASAYHWLKRVPVHMCKP